MKKNEEAFDYAKALAKKVGGHGGMDFLMDYRMIYCLRFRHCLK